MEVELYNNYDMKNLIIIGAGNIGKIVCEYARQMKEYQTEWLIGGYLEFDGKEVARDQNYPEIIGTVEDYQPKANDVFVCSYAAVADREKSVQIIESKGGVFINVIHPTANILSTNKMGVGNIIGAFTTLSVNTVVGNHCIVQDHCNVGHDCVIGDFSHLYVGNIVCGINTLGTKVTLYTGSVIYPKFKVGDNSVVGAGSVVMRAVKADATVMGNPAKKLE